MDVAVVVDRVRRVAAVRGDATAELARLEAGLRDVTAVRSYLDAAEVDLARRVAAASSFPEAALADSSRGSLGAAGKTLDRSRTLDAAPEYAELLDAGLITAGHVDVITRTMHGLDDEHAERLAERLPGLTDVAAVANVPDFGKRLRDEADRITAEAGVDRLERQRRDTRLNSWVDQRGMWNVRGQFDPVSGLALSTRLEQAVETLFAESTPDTCPTDPVEKQRHLRALAFAALVNGTAGTNRSGRPEFVAVIDVAAGPVAPTSVSQSPAAQSPAVSATGFQSPVSQSPVVSATGSAAQPAAFAPTVTSEFAAASVESGRATVSWPIPIEVPHRVIAELLGDADVVTVVVRNGVVLHAPGELQLGRSTRLANRAQRRALRALYATCAIPGCSVRYDRCKLHHVVWWRHGGRTDLDNLLPVCSEHHHRIHDAGWEVELGPQRELTVRFPDGTVRNTGPPRRRAA